jgi:hypothetical protein
VAPIRNAVIIDSPVCEAPPRSLLHRIAPPLLQWPGAFDQRTESIDKSLAPDIVQSDASAQAGKRLASRA